MLHLSRRTGEAVIIDSPLGRITVEVVRIGGHAVRLGVTAHPSIPVFRGEIYAERRRGGPPPCLAIPEGDGRTD